ncbi:MAG: nitrate/nitrite transporter NrtS [Actinomycetota bacterium]|nr:nitrate/nitrite transporter NrtS [Actinomycetota bacterium]
MQELVFSSEGKGEENTLGCRHIKRARLYQFGRDASDPLCLTCAILYRPVLRCAIYIALLVGTILTIINQGDVLLTGAIAPLVLVKILLTYTVPYSVSTFSALSANWVKETSKKSKRP